MAVILEEGPRQYATKQPENASAEAQILPDECVMRMYKIDLFISIYHVYSSTGRSVFHSTANEAYKVSTSRPRTKPCRDTRSGIDYIPRIIFN